MDRRTFIGCFAVGLLAAPRMVRAQGGARMIRIGILVWANPRSASFYVAMEQRLSQLGYVEGRNLHVEFRTAAGDHARLPGLAQELIAEKCDVLVASGPEVVIRAARDAAGAVPIVMLAVDFDPVATGYVRSLRRPGTNMTGVNLQQIELTSKRVELLHELLQQVNRVAVLGDVSVRDQLEAAQRSASRFGLKLLPFEVGKPPHDYNAAFRTMRASDPQALLVLLSGTFYRDRAQIVALARETRLPAIYGATGFVEAGGLFAYGANLDDLFSKAADYVDGVLKGSKPAEMPIEQPTKFDMAINLKTAKALGLTIPQSLLLRANQVIQ